MGQPEHGECDSDHGGRPENRLGQDGDHVEDSGIEEMEGTMCRDLGTEGMRMTMWGTWAMTGTMWRDPGPESMIMTMWGDQV